MRSWMEHFNTKRKIFTICIAIVLFLSVGYIAQQVQGQKHADVLFVDVKGIGLSDVTVRVYSDIEVPPEGAPIEYFEISRPFFGSYSFKLTSLESETTSITVGIYHATGFLFTELFEKLDVDISEKIKMLGVTFNLLFTRTNDYLYPRYPIELVFVGIIVVIGVMLVPKTRWRKR